MQRRKVVVVEAELKVRNFYEGDIAEDGEYRDEPVGIDDDSSDLILEISGLGELGKALAGGLKLAVVLSGSDWTAGYPSSPRAFFLDGSRLDSVKNVLRPFKGATHGSAINGLGSLVEPSLPAR